jgi:hypothetical protein
VAFSYKYTHILLSKITGFSYEERKIEGRKKEDRKKKERRKKEE